MNKIMNNSIGISYLKNCLSQMYFSYIILDHVNGKVVDSLNFEYSIDKFYISNINIPYYQKLTEFITNSNTEDINMSIIEVLYKSEYSDLSIERFLVKVIDSFPTYIDHDFVLLTPYRSIDIEKIIPFLFLSPKKCHYQFRTFFNQQEHTIMVLLALGYSYKEIATQISATGYRINESKIGIIVRNKIQRALNVNNRVDLLSKCLLNGLVSPVLV